MGNKDIKVYREKHILQPNVLQRIKTILNENTEENVDYNREERNFNAKFSESFDEILNKKLKNLHLNIPLDNKFQINQQYNKKCMLPDGGKMLPIFKYKKQILEGISNERFTLITGETGCGKSTQVPQMILEHYIEHGRSTECTIICTQPRRISAISLAERVAQERKSRVGETVGYQIRLEKCMPDPKAGSILYCTTGVLLRKIESDQLLSKITHIILDEIHERSVDLDLLIGLLKIVVQYNKQLKIILMSATFVIDQFVNYFGECAVIQIPGKMYPVVVNYLEDILQDVPFEFKAEIKTKRTEDDPGKYTVEEQKEFKKLIEPYAQDLHKNGKYSWNVINSIKNQNSEGVNLLFIKTLIFHITFNKPEGAILTFLPGYDQIEELFNLLTKSREYNKDKFKIYMLHSLMSSEKQRGVFVRPKKGVRKIILSTTIAETSITIDDAVYIINPGRVKINDYDIKNNYEILIEKWIAIAQSKQRQGRAGRCQPGICYNLYTRAREAKFMEYPIPEIKRSRLEPVILRLKFLCIKDIYEFLKTLLDCPDKKTLENGFELLKRINALNSNETITPLGYHMARLPLDPQIAKMLVMSAVFDCIAPITSICATLSYKEPFYRSMRRGDNFNLKDAKLELSNDAYSDELLYAYVIEDYNHIAKNNNAYYNTFVRENFISISIMNQLNGFRSQLNDILLSVKFSNQSSNNNSNKEHLLKGIIAAGLYPNIAYVRNVTQTKKNIKQDIVTTEDNKNVILHKWSVNSDRSDFDSKFLVYCQKRKGKKEICLHDSTMIYPDALIIFGDQFEAIHNDENNEYIIKISNNIEFLTDYETFELIKILRSRFETLLRKLALNPIKNKADQSLLNALILFLSCDLT